MSRLTDWKGLLRVHVPQARQMVRKLVIDRIVFTPDATSLAYTFQATGTLSRFFSGLAYPQAVASHLATTWNPGEDLIADLRSLFRESAVITTTGAETGPTVSAGG